LADAHCTGRCNPDRIAAALFASAISVTLEELHKEPLLIA